MEPAPVTVALQPSFEPGNTTRPARGWKPVALWLLAGALLLSGLGGRPVQRTQEARVLETARQMLGKPLDRWMVPRVNDRLRLRKPPIAYWAAAGAFVVGGVSEAVGRVPTAPAGWLTVGGVYAAGTWLFSRRAGLLAAAALLSSYLFFWHARLAETDAWATVFVTFGTFAFWRAINPGPAAAEVHPTAPRAAVWFHLGAACVALASLSKGAPALFPMLFLIGLSLVRGRPKALWEFVRCGAPLTAVAPGLLWLWYASRHADLGQIGEEFSNNWRGQGHGSPFYLYLYLLPVAAVPWTGVMVVAVVEAVRRWRDPRLQGLFVWAGSVLLPLFVTGNKQPHYLMMVMPCLMAFVGWAMDEMLTQTERQSAAEPSSPRPAGAVSAVFRVSVWACAVAAIGAPFAARKVRGAARPFDVAVAVGIVVAMAAVLWIGRRQSVARAVWAFAAAWAVALTVANAWWWPSVEPNDPRAVAAELRRVAGDGPYCSYGAVAYLPLCFALRQEVPAAFTLDELRQQVAEQPGVHVIVRRRVRDARALPEASFLREIEVRSGDAVFELYRPAGGAALRGGG